MSKEIKCARCGSIIPEKQYLLQHMVYLGKSTPRLDICENCNESFKYWFSEIKNFKEEQSNV